MIGRLKVLRESVRNGFWAVPTLCVLVAVVLSTALVRLDHALSDGFGGRFTFGAGPDGAREVLSAITSSLITFTGLVFSITVVVLQLTSSQFSPRVLRTFLRDRVTQTALGMFVATFVYALLVLRTVDSGDAAFVPAVSTSVAVLLLLVSVGMFVAFIHHITQAIQASTIIATTGDETRRLLERLPPAERPDTEQPLWALPGPPTLQLPARTRGVVTGVDEQALVKAAQAADVVLVLRARTGDYVPEGALLVDVHGASDGLHAAAVLDAVSQGRRRTMDQDIAFGIRQLVDIAERALSPGTNDPTTAVQVLDELHDVLRRLATRHLPSHVVCGPDGQVRLVRPPVRFGDLLALALDEIEQYGADALPVRHRIRALLTELASAALPAHRQAVEDRLARYDTAG